MAERFWAYDNDAHRQLFGKLLAPLIAAAGSLETRRWDDEAYARTQLRTWMLMLGDVPEDVLIEAFERKVMEGVTWMVRPGEIKNLCADVVDARRAVMAKRVEQMKARCELRKEGTCVNDFLQEGKVVKRCDCHLTGVAMMRQITAPIERPALAAAADVEGV